MLPADRQVGFGPSHHHLFTGGGNSRRENGWGVNMTPCADAAHGTEEVNFISQGDEKVNLAEGCSEVGPVESRDDDMLSPVHPLLHLFVEIGEELPFIHTDDIGGGSVHFTQAVNFDGGVGYFPPSLPRGEGLLGASIHPGPHAQNGDSR